MKIPQPLIDLKFLLVIFAMIPIGAGVKFIIDSVSTVLPFLLYNIPPNFPDLAQFFSSILLQIDIYIGLGLIYLGYRILKVGYESFHNLFLLVYFVSVFSVLYIVLLIRNKISHDILTAIVFVAFISIPIAIKNFMYIWKKFHEDEKLRGEGKSLKGKKKFKKYF